MTLTLPYIKLVLGATTTEQEAAGIVAQNPTIDLAAILFKTPRTLWPYVIYGYQCEYCEPSFVPQVFSPSLYYNNKCYEQKAVEQASAQPCSPTRFGVPVMQSKDVKSDFQGARRDDPLFKSFFDDLAKGKNKAFVAARLKAATGKDASFLDNPDEPPQ